MAHEIEGNYAFFANSTPAWHGIGTVLKDAPSIEEAWKMAYPHELFKLPLTAHIEGQSMEIKNHCAIIRDDGKEIGVVGSGFEVVQPYKVFQSFEPMIEAGLVELEAGGSLQDGKRMWALAKIKGAEADVVKGDPVKSYALMYTGFDGSLSIGCSQTNARVVCANTLRGAMSLGIDFKIRHTKTVHDRINDAMGSIQAAIARFHESVDVYRALAEKKVTYQQQANYVADVLLTPDVARDFKKRGDVPTKTENKIRYVVDLLENQRGLELVPAIRGTAWQAYNAVSEYLTHDHGRNADSRVNSQWFGESARLNSRALELAQAM